MGAFDDVVFVVYRLNALHMEVPLFAQLAQHVYVTGATAAEGEIITADQGANVGLTDEEVFDEGGGGCGGESGCEIQHDYYFDSKRAK